jgi:hypothetical protein
VVRILSGAPVLRIPLLLYCLENHGYARLRSPAPQRSSRSRSHDTVIRVYDDAGNVIETMNTKAISKSHKFTLIRCGKVLGLVILNASDSSAGLKAASFFCGLAGQSLAAALRYMTLWFVALRRRS